MKLIIGLGNPGEKYKNNRHNVGFIVLDELAKKLRVEKFALSQGVGGQYAWTSLKGVKIELFKPQNFMNNSGDSVVYAYKKHPEITLGDIYIIHDDLDIKLGDFKIQKGKGPREHKGLLSIYESLGRKDFWHVRVGIENRNNELGIRNNGNRKLSGEDYVLQDFTNEELKKLRTVIGKVVKDLTQKFII